MKLYIKSCFFMFITATAFIYAEEDQEAISAHQLTKTENYNLVDEDLIPRTLLDTPHIIPPFQTAIVKTIAYVDSEGQWIRLADGSSWDVAYYFGRKEVRNHWRPGDNVVICYADRFFMTPIAIHNITQGLSVYGYFKYPPVASAPEVVYIKSIHHNSPSFETNVGTIVSFNAYPHEWLEFAVGDVVLLTPPQEGTLDGSQVCVWNMRLMLIFHHLLSQQTVATE